jgi:cytochrome c oxidase subunit II
MSRIHLRSLRVIALLSTLVAVALSGCQGDRVQSSLHPAGPAAEAVAQLWWILLAILGTYSLVVFILTLVAIFRPVQKNPPKHGGRVFILIGGVILPALILVPLLVYSVTTTRSLRMRDGGLTIRVIGHRWWWEVEYPDQQIITANELYIPAGEPVRLEMTSADIIHSFWVPQLHGKADMLPGKTTDFWIEADRPGIYRGQCAEFCGVQHALMAFEVIALPPDEFAQWIVDHQQPPQTPQSDQLLAGKQLFMKHGCGACHAVAGTPAQGRAGPDLTLLGIRKTLAAATTPNTPEDLLAWLIDPQSIKPGANMPPTHASTEELELIVSYLFSLDGKGGGDEPGE